MRDLRRRAYSRELVRNPTKHAVLRPLVLLFLLSCAGLATAQDVVIIVADDVAYADLERVPTPNLDRLRARGLEFHRAYAMPLCAPTRRSIYFGTWWTGITGNRCAVVDGSEPNLTEVSLAELDPASWSYFSGKWHLGGNAVGAWQLAPEAHGFDVARAWHMANLFQCQSSGYFSWQRLDRGRVTTSTVYEPRAILDQFLRDWSIPATQRRLAVLSPALGHSPYHRPPPDMLAADWPATPDANTKFEAMIAALDLFVGKVMSSVDLDRDLVVFVGDNGTADPVSPAPGKSKGTTFERGIHVPLILAGGGLEGSSSTEALVHVADIYATVADFWGVPLTGGDSTSLFRLADEGREHVICGAVGELDHFGNPGDMNSDLCVRTKSLKYRRTERFEQLFDLELDPFETVDRLADPAYADALAELRVVLDEYLERDHRPSNPLSWTEEPVLAPALPRKR